MTGDGFGGRAWYKPTNYAVGSYCAFNICGLEKQIYGWGSNYQNVLGEGTNATGYSTPVAAIGMNNVKYVTSGYVTAAIKTDNTGWVWGSGASILGTGFNGIPKKVIDSVKFVDVSQSSYVFIKEDGSVWSLGNNYGQFGLGSLPPPNLEVDTTPRKMIGINNAVRVASMSGGTVILLSDGTVKQVAAPNSYIQPGPYSYLPEVVPNLTNIVDIKAATNNVIA